MTTYVLLCGDLHFEMPEGVNETDELQRLTAARDAKLEFYQTEWAAACMVPPRDFITQGIATASATYIQALGSARGQS